MDGGKKLAILVSTLFLLYCSFMAQVSSDPSISWDINLNFREEAV